MSFSQNYTINSRGFQNKLNEVDRLFTKGDITSGNKLHAWKINLTFIIRLLILKLLK